MEISCIKKFDNFQGYLNKRNIKFFYLFLFIFLVLLLSYISLKTGEFNISVFDILSKKTTDSEIYIFYNIRLLRVFAAIIAGGGLGLSGALLQIILRNPMASPYTIGIVQGASFGASFAIIFFSAGSMMAYGEGVLWSSNVVILGAFLGSIIAMSIIFFISSLKSFSKYTIILSGISVGAVFHALTMFIQYFADDIKVAATIFWTFGDISKFKWSAVWFSLPFILFSIFYFTIKGWKLNMFGFGSEFLKTSGIDYKKLTIIALLSVLLIVSIITSYIGIIGFVGLLAPHISRFFAKGDSRFLIPYSFLWGAIILIISDIISRVAFYPAIIPVGIITSFFGIVVLVYLIMRDYDRD